MNAWLIVLIIFVTLMIATVAGLTWIHFYIQQHDNPVQPTPEEKKNA